MSANQVRLMVYALLAALIIAAFVTTVGLLTEPAAIYFDVEITAVATQFTWLTGGVFLGGILAFFVFDYVSIKAVTVGSYLTAIVLIGWLHLSTSFFLLPFFLLLIGALLVIVICGGVTVMTQQWRGRTRQMIIVAQDAMFNGGGIVFTAAATWFVVHDYGWSTIYLIAAGLISLVVLLVLLSSFTPVIEQDDETEQATVIGDWNSGIVLVGISLLLFMMAKISIFVWAPQYIQQNFDVGLEVGGEFMANVFIAAFFGSLFGTWVASKIEVRYLLYGLAAVSTASIFAFIVTESLDTILILGYCYGISIAATFNSYVAFGLSFVDQPNHKNIVYLQLMSGLGATLAPFVSSTIVQMTGSVNSGMRFCFTSLLVVGGSLIICEVLYRKLKLTEPAAKYIAPA